MRSVEPKTGWRTTEFWLALLGMAIGAVVIRYGSQAVGGAVVAAIPVGYAVARALEKRAAHVANAEIESAAASTRSRVI